MSKFANDEEIMYNTINKDENKIKGVIDGTFTKTEGLIKSIDAIKNEYRRYSNDNDLLSRRTDNSNDKISVGLNGEQRTNNSTKNIEQNSRNESIKMRGLKNFMTKLEEIMIKALTIHDTDKETAKIIYLMMMNNEKGQNTLIQYLLDMKNLTEEDIINKVKEISQV